MKLLMFSGGFDSTSLLKYLLERGKLNGDNLLVHHIKIKNKHKDRWIPEDESANKIIKYFQKKYNFEYTTSTVELFDNHKTLDSSLYSLMAAQIVRKHRLVLEIEKIDEVFVAWLDSDIGPEIEHEVTKNIFYSALGSLKDVNAKWSTPFLEKDKKDIKGILTQEETEMTFSCRYPKNGKPCGTCFACTSNKKINIFNSYK